MAGDSKSDLPAPTAEQQRVLDRIAQQRERIRARHIAGMKNEALAPLQLESIPAAAPLAIRAVTLATRYPLLAAAVATAAAGVAIVAGPRRLVRWAGIAMPLFRRLQPLLNHYG